MVNYLGNIQTVLGNKKIPLELIAKEFDKDLEKAKRTTGVDEIRQFDKSQDLINESVNCINNSNVQINGIFASLSTPSIEFSMPSFASQIANKLELKGLAANTNPGCAGVGYALLAAHNQLVVDSLNGLTRSYAIVAGDHTSKTLKDEWATKALFSDAVATCIVSNDPTLNLDYILNSANMIQLPHEDFMSMGVKTSDQKFFMEGRKVYNFVKNEVFSAFSSMTKEISSDAIIIPHSASAMSIRALKSYNHLPCDIYEDGLKGGNKQVASTLFGLADINNKYNDIYLMPFGAELAVGSISLKRKK